MAKSLHEKELEVVRMEHAIRKRQFQSVQKFCGLPPDVMYDIPRYLVRFRRELFNPMLVLYGDPVLLQAMAEGRYNILHGIDPNEEPVEYTILALREALE